MEYCSRRPFPFELLEVNQTNLPWRRFSKWLRTPKMKETVYFARERSVPLTTGQLYSFFPHEYDSSNEALSSPQARWAQYLRNTESLLRMTSRRITRSRNFLPTRAYGKIKSVPLRSWRSKTLLDDKDSGWHDKTHKRWVSLTATEVQRIYCKCETLVIMESDGKYRHSDDTLYLLSHDDEWHLYKVDVLKSKCHHFGANGILHTTWITESSLKRHVGFPVFRLHQLCCNGKNSYEES